MKYTHLIFDIDGTVVDTQETAVLSLQKTIKDLMGIDMDYDKVYPYFGIPSSKVASRLGYEKEMEFAHAWEQNFIDMKYLMKPFPGVLDMLRDLKEQGYHLGVVTSRSLFEVHNDEIFMQMHDLFEYIISAEDTTKHKPDPEPIAKLLEKASEAEGRKVEAQECLYFGDTPHDWGCASGAGCAFALADWKNKGFQGIDADYKFSSVEEIMAIL